MRTMEKLKLKTVLEVDKKQLDEALEKANRLVELLREAKQIIDSLSSIEA